MPTGTAPWLHLHPNTCSPTAHARGHASARHRSGLTEILAGTALGDAVPHAYGCLRRILRLLTVAVQLCSALFQCKSYVATCFSELAADIHNPQASVSRIGPS